MFSFLSIFAISAKNSGIRKIMVIPKKLTIGGQYLAFIPLRDHLNLRNGWD
jgi:hypothetical protein